MLKKTLLSVIAAVMALGASAQLSTTDAQWCDVMEQAMADQGLQAQVRCDRRGADRVLHVTAQGRTYNYTVPTRTGLPDYSSPVYIAAYDFSVRPQQRDFRPDPRTGYCGDIRQWMGPRSSTYSPEAVFLVSSDYDYLESALRTALTRVSRVQLVDVAYAQDAAQFDGPLYYLRGTVVALQRGENYVKEKAPEKDAPGAHPQQNRPGSRTMPYEGQRVDRKFAYGKVHLELTDAATGVIVWSDDISSEDYTSFASTNPMENVVNRMARTLTERIQRLCPSVAPRAAVSGLVLRADDEAKNKTHTLFINLGTAQQLRKGDVLSVYAVKSVGNYDGRELIGSVSVADVQGPELTYCKVKKGEREIYAALQAGATLVVEGALD